MALSLQTGKKNEKNAALSGQSQGAGPCGLLSICRSRYPGPHRLHLARLLLFRRLVRTRGTCSLGRHVFVFQVHCSFCQFDFSAAACLSIYQPRYVLRMYSVYLRTSSHRTLASGPSQPCRVHKLSHNDAMTGRTQHGNAECTKLKISALVKKGPMLALCWQLQWQSEIT